MNLDPDRDYSPAVHLDGSIFDFDSAFLTCLDAASGEERWRHRLASGALILVDRHLLTLDTMEGGLHLVAASPDGFEERSIARVFERGREAYAPPSFAAGRIFLRNHEEMVALDVVHGAAEPPAVTSPFTLEWEETR